ncbi:AAA family ATPase [Clostridium botulinum]|nr:AAA family ATPase [Clostridium botulinum]
MKVIEVIPQLIRASLEKDQNSVEVISLTISNMIRNKYPQVSEEIDKVLFDKNIGSSAYRSIGLSDIPTDKKNNENLIDIKEVNEIDMPVLSKENTDILNKFIKEQDKKLDLMKVGIKPTNSILFFGEPGVGKTYSAMWLSSKLKKPLVMLDLATVMSSYLGETGSNIKKVLEYAKENDCILFLDEFDAIAKTRTDDRELGEIKRIVNVLLKELEEWPIGSIIIAATNHEELLDKAIWRRFDLKIHLDLPNKDSRIMIIKREFEKINQYIDEDVLNILGEALKDENGAEIVRVCIETKREHILEGQSISKLLIKKCGKYIENWDKQSKIELVKKMNSNELTIKEINKLTQISTSTLYRYLEKN